MTAQILDGKAVAAKQRQASASRAAEFKSEFGRMPGLAVIKVGEDPASAVYVRNKRKACEECGIASFAHDLPASTSREELLGLVDRLNRDDAVDGILLQLPLPKGLDSTEIMDTIDPAKDVDGFHPTNTGLLAQKRPGLRPCTPWGVIKLAEEYKLVAYLPFADPETEAITRMAAALGVPVSQGPEGAPEINTADFLIYVFVPDEVDRQAVTDLYGLDINLTLVFTDPVDEKFASAAKGRVTVQYVEPSDNGPLTIAEADAVLN